MTSTTCRFVLLAGLCLSSVASAQNTVRGTFGGHSFAIALPDGFSALEPETPLAGAKRFVYVTEMRADQSRGLIAVAIIELKQMGSSGISLDEFSSQLLAGMRPAYVDWKEKENLGTLDGVPAKRLVWSGGITQEGGGASIAVGGVSILGNKNDVGFYLHTFDREFQFASRQRAEAALATFTLTAAATTPTDSSNPLALLKKGCDAGNTGDCVEFGDAYEVGKGVPVDHARAMAAYEAACDQGSLAICEVVGQKYGLVEENARAVPFLAKACDGGLPHACYVLALYVGNGAGVAKDPARAASLYKGACDRGVMIACSTLGYQYSIGNGVLKDVARAIALYKQGCDGGNAEGCQQLAVAYADGEGVVKDPTRAAALYQRACEGGVMVACVNLGARYDRGTGVPKDPARANTLWEFACEKGESHGCFNRAGVFRQEENLEKAEEFFRKSCDGGNKEGCDGLQETLGARQQYERLLRESLPRASEPKPGEPKEVCVRHILIKIGPVAGESGGRSEAEARSLMTGIHVSLTAMNNDFADLARRFSDDASSAKGGGDLGCFVRGVMVKEFEDVAFALKVGETSPVVKTPFGLHVIQRLAKAAR